MKSKSKALNPSSSFERFSPEIVVGYSIIAGLYLMWILMYIGWRSDHSLFFFGVSALFFASEYTRKLVYAFGFILLYWFIFDSIRLFPNYEVNPLHIAEPYLAEKAWFGIETAQGVLTPNEYWAQHRHIILSTYTAIIYLAWIPVPLAFSLYHFFKGKRHIVIHYLFTFLLVSQLGLLFQFIYPAAPPWYVAEYGFEAIFNTPGNPGALIEVDQYYGISLFEGMYDMNGNVFAAIPSLHCAFPIILLYFAAAKKLKGWLALAIIMMVSTWFAAVYTNHHYVIDVILGISTGALAVSIYHFIVRKTRVYDWLNRYARFVS
ncbi:MAG: phosphatase PAP2 family protein [Saprospiraceae bacterium]